MATAVRPGEEEKGRKGRRSRARARAEALADSAVTIPIAEALEDSVVTIPIAEAVPVAPAVDEPSESRLAAAVRARRERKQAAAEAAAALAPTATTAPVPEREPEAEAAEAEPFHDLLGQAIGLRLDAVTRDFDTGDMKVVALREVSLEIGPGEFVAVIGPSGCGKTTLLSMMGGLDQPTTGQVYAAGVALDQLSDQALADYRLQRVSTIFQTFNLVPGMSAEENVILPLTLAGVEPEERRFRARRLLALVGLEGRSRMRASRLSGGEQQKVAVARALANRPGLVLADEPTGSLDSVAGERVLDLLRDLNRRGATVVLVTHDPEVARHAQRAVRMVDGRAYELGSGTRNVRMQDPLLPAPRLHWRDTLRLGLLSAGRRPLRTFLTTAGVAIGIAAMSLIVALSGGLDYALAAPAFAHAKTDVIAVRPASDSASAAFDAQSLNAMASLPHVQSAWGEVSVNGSFAGANGTIGGANDQLIALAQRARGGCAWIHQSARRGRDHDQLQGRGAEARPYIPHGRRCRGRRELAGRGRGGPGALQGDDRPLVRRRRGQQLEDRRVHGHHAACRFGTQRRRCSRSRGEVGIPGHGHRRPGARVCGAAEPATRRADRPFGGGALPGLPRHREHDVNGGARAHARDRGAESCRREVARRDVVVRRRSRGHRAGGWCDRRRRRGRAVAGWQLRGRCARAGAGG